MIMAAGAGTRLDPLTQTVPKPMIPVVNTPIIELILKHLKNYGIKDVVANTHYLAACIQEKYAENNLGINFNYVHEPELSGTAGGVKKCEWFFEPGETFLVISGDALTDINLHELIQKHKSTGALATMALREVPMTEVSQFGVVVVDEDSKVVGFQEKPSMEEAKSNLVNTGIYVFETDIFKYIPENTFYDFAKNVFPAVMANNEILCAHTIKKYWSDIGTLNQYRLSCYDVLTSKVTVNPPYKETELGWISDSTEISSKTIFNGRIVVGDKTVIEDNVKFYGNSIIGNNCIIKKGASLRNCIIWDNVTIEEGSKLDGCIIANNTVVGNKSIITPGCVIPENCIISERAKLFEDIKLRSGEEYSPKMVEAKK